MILRETELFRAERIGRHLQIALKVPHAVLSSCPVNGGWRNDLSFLINHQSGEGRGGDLWTRLVPHVDEDAHHRQVCEELQISADHTAMLNTAANMQYVAHAGESDGNLGVSVFVTAGVRGNAARAGDRATWREDDTGNYVPVAKDSEAPPLGTIHILALYNRPLRPSAMTRCAATLTEAKVAVLQELAVPSLYGPGLATGTGTDGFALAAAEISGMSPKRHAGAHFKLGEITARAVTSALREALHWQNGLDPAMTRNLFYALSRFGIQENSLMDALHEILNGDVWELLSRNREALWHDPQIAAAAYGLAAVMDRAAWGTLPPSARDEAVLHQLALMACALAQDTVPFSEFRKVLVARWNGLEQGLEKPFEKILAQAIAMGWRAKWKFP